MQYAAEPAETVSCFVGRREGGRVGEGERRGGCKHCHASSSCSTAARAPALHCTLEPGKCREGMKDHPAGQLQAPAGAHRVNSL